MSGWVWGSLSHQSLSQFPVFETMDCRCCLLKMKRLLFRRRLACFDICNNRHSLWSLSHTLNWPLQHLVVLTHILGFGVTDVSSFVKDVMFLFLILLVAFVWFSRGEGVKSLFCHFKMKYNLLTLINLAFWKIHFYTHFLPPDENFLTTDDWGIAAFVSFKGNLILLREGLRA